MGRFSSILFVFSFVVIALFLLAPDSEGLICDSCGDYNDKLGSIVEVSVPDIGYYYCSDCLSDDVYRCINCGRFQGIGSGFVIETGLCDECSDRAYVPCFECDYEFPENILIHYQNRYICKSCAEVKLSQLNSSLNSKSNSSTHKPFTAEDISKMLENYTFSHSGQNSYVASKPESSINYTVYVTPTGSKYHKLSCSYIKSRSRAIDLQTAVGQGYTACSRCF